MLSRRGRSSVGALLAGLLSVSTVVAQDAPSASEHIRQGVLLASHGEHEAALERLERGIELDPSQAQAWFARALSRSALGQRAEAIADYGEALTRDPAFALAHINRGALRTEAGDLPGALEDFEAAVRLTPTDPRGWLGRARARAARDDFAAAIADFGEVLRLQPDSVPARLGRGRVQLRAGDAAAAAIDYSEAVQFAPQNTSALLGRGCAHQALGELDRALADFEAALALDSTLAEALVDHALLRVQLGELALAVDDLTRALELTPQATELLALRAELYRDLGQLAEARADCEALLAQLPESASTLTIRADVRALEGDEAGALADCDRALELEPGLGPALFSRARLLSARGDHERALVDATAAINALPESAAARFLRGTIRLRAGDTAGATEDYDASIRLRFDDGQAWVNRGLARVRGGDVRGGIEDYGQALELNADDALALNNRATARQLLGDTLGALDDLDHALRVEPDDALALCNRGLIKLALRDATGAKADLERALELAPGDDETLLALARASALGGELGPALAHLDATSPAAPPDLLARIHWTRGFIRLSQGELQAAQAEASAGLRAEARADLHLLHGMAAALLGERDAALAALDEAAGLGSQSAALWAAALSADEARLAKLTERRSPVGRLARFHKGELSAQELLVWARQTDAADDRLRLAHAQLGVHAEVAGQAEQARAAYGEVRARGFAFEPEYAWAAARLTGPDWAPWQSGGAPPEQPAPPTETPTPEPSPALTAPEASPTPVASAEVSPSPALSPGPSPEVAASIPPAPSPSALPTPVASAVVTTPASRLPPDATDAGSLAILALLLASFLAVLVTGARLLLASPESQLTPQASPRPGAAKNLDDSEDRPPSTPSYDSSHEDDDELGAGKQRSISPEELEQQGLPPSFIPGRFRDPKARSGNFDLPRDPTTGFSIKPRTGKHPRPENANPRDTPEDARPQPVEPSGVGDLLEEAWDDTKPFEKSVEPDRYDSMEDARALLAPAGASPKSDPSKQDSTEEALDELIQETPARPAGSGPAKVSFHTARSDQGPLPEPGVVDDADEDHEVDEETRELEALFREFEGAINDDADTLIDGINPGDPPVNF